MARLGPFPGMDPWLESRWSGVHHWLITSVGEQLNEVLPENFIARVEERVFVGYVDGDRRSINPDVYVVEDLARRVPARAEAARGTAVADAPLLIRFGDEPVTEGFIEIVDAGDESAVVTAVEVLSPTNKSDAHNRPQYLRKRDEYHRARVSTIEVDLLRRGQHTVGVPSGYVTGAVASPYRACVRRGWRLPELEAEYYRIELRSPLPRILVPLRPSDPDAVLDLQAAFETAYRRGRYDRTRYDRPPEPPLPPDDAAWAEERIAAWRAGGGA